MARLRYRQRVSGKVLDPYTVLFVGSEDPSVDYMAKTCLSHHEVMHDVVGNPTGMNPCSHTVIRSSTSDKPPDFISGSNSRIVYPAWIFEGGGGPPRPSSTQINDFAWDAFLDATTQVPESVSVPNFLLELGDLKKLVLKWHGDILKLIAEGFLAWQFGIKPILSDIKKIFNAVKDARKRLAWLRKTYGKPTSIHFRKTVDVKPHQGVIPDDVFSYDVLKWATLHPYSSSATWTLTSTIRVYHELQGLDSATALLDTLAALTGWQNPLKVIWNAIPFSFLLEYFVQLDHLLTRCQLASFTGEIRVLDACWAMKAETQSKVMSPTWVPPAGFAPGHCKMVHRGAVDYTVYERARGIPLAASVFWKETLSPIQLAILAALIYLNGRQR